ncbi:hypothetical protein Tco_0042443, partial [Tanacetum coccineum]
MGLPILCCAVPENKERSEGSERRLDGKLPLKRFDLRLRTLNASSSPRVPDGIWP